jgi:TonB family protein
MNFKILLLFVLSFGLSSVFAQDPAQDNSKTISGGILNDKAISLPEPAYSAAARAVRAYGTVNVQVTIDENGDVISAMAVSGHPLLRAGAVQAARQAKFIPTTLQGKTVKVNGTIIYIFITPGQWQFFGETLGDSEVEIETNDNLLQVSTDLASVYPDIAKSVKTIADNYDKDEDSARFQTNAISQTIAQLQSKLTNFSKSSWYFELGLAVGRLKANYFDDMTLRANLPKMKELADSYSELDIKDSDGEETLEKLTQLGEMANRPFYSRKDKSKIKKLIDSL